VVMGPGLRRDDDLYVWARFVSDIGKCRFS
jgi:hypothetical protein